MAHQVSHYRAQACVVSLSDLVPNSQGHRQDCAQDASAEKEDRHTRRACSTRRRKDRPPPLLLATSPSHHSEMAPRNATFPSRSPNRTASQVGSQQLSSTYFPAIDL